MNIPAGTAPGLIWVEPALESPSGGQLYNRHVVDGLRDSGMEVRVVAADGAWPRPSEEQRRVVWNQLEISRLDMPGAPVVIDGLIGGCMPELFTRLPDGGSTVLLVHLPLAADAEHHDPHQEDPRASGSDLAHLETQAVSFADRVVATSSWAAEDLRARHGRAEIDVVVPGVHTGVHAEVDTGVHTERLVSAPLRLTVAASITPRKNHRLLGAALAGLQHHDWVLQLAGPGAGSGYGADVLAGLRHDLPDRVHHLGSLPPQDMAGLWARTDLLLLPSWAETYGMVVIEACAHGVPAVVSSGTGAVEALGEAGAAADPAEPQQWTLLLETWMQDPALRAHWADLARRRAGRLPSWTQTADRWMTLLASLPTG